MYTNTHQLLPILLETIVVAIIIAFLKGLPLPLIKTPRASLVSLLIVGLATCVLGGENRSILKVNGSSPLAITVSLFGIVVLVSIISALTSWNLPIISGEIKVVTAVGILIL